MVGSNFVVYSPDSDDCYTFALGNPGRAPLVYNNLIISKMKKKKDKAMKTIEKGEQLTEQLVATLFAVTPNIDGAVAMTYALSKTYVALKSALKEVGINVDPYFRNMVKMWEGELK